MVINVSSSLGYGSGLDIPKLVSDLAAASRLPKIARLDARAAVAQTTISAVARIKSSLEAVASSLAAVVGDGTLQTQPNVSDPAVLTAKAIPGQSLSPITTQVEVLALARGQTLASAPSPAASAPVGQGTLRLTVGGVAHDIVITSSNDSLSGLAAAITASDSGARASLVNDGGGVRLVVRGPTGEANAFTLERIAGDAALDRFSTAQMTVAQTAADASLRVDGIMLSRPSNIVDDVVPGMVLTLRTARPGGEVSIGTQPPGDAIRSALTDFATAYNDVRKILAEAPAATRNDGEVRAFERAFTNLVSQPLTSDPNINSLTAIGFSTNRDGTIAFDRERFAGAYRSDPAAVEQIFVPLRTDTRTQITDPGLNTAFGTLATAFGARLGGVSTRLGKEAQSVERKRERVEARELLYRGRLERQFANIDVRIGAIKSTQSFLDQQIKLWTTRN